MTNQALQSWRCDTCAGPVTDPNAALVIWRTDEQNRGYDFRLVHKSTDGRTCDPEARSGYVSSLELSSFLGPGGAAMLLSWLSAGPIRNELDSVRVKNFDEYVDLFRRVQTPWYEEARPHFNDEATHHWLGDANEYLPYMPDTLHRIANGTLGRR